MKQYRKELDVDFIGGQEPLTQDEENAISEYIRIKKRQSQRQPAKRLSQVPGGSKKQLFKAS